MATQQIAQKTGKKLFGKTFGKIFKWGFLFFFLLIPLLYAIVLSVQAGDIGVGLHYFAPRILEPTKIIIEQTDLLVQNEGQHESFFGFVLTWWNLLSSIYIIFRWIWLFQLIWAFFLDKSRVSINWVMGMMTFFILEIIYLLYIQEPNGLMIPFQAIGNLFKAFPYLIKPFARFVDSGVENTTIENVTNLINSTNVTSINSSKLIV